ncbi:MAG: caspase family protein [Caldilineaceae bacterium]
MSKKMAILVGLTQVDPAAYNNWDGKNGCEGCELDVDNMTKILTPLGYAVTQIKTADATKENVLTQLDTVAEALTAGDRLVFFYAGHGGQQPDQNGDELDGRDETLVAYDGEIIDDQLNDIWLKFAEGVKIVMLSDSCNSGTNYRDIRTVVTATPLKPVDEQVNDAMLAELIHIGGCRDGFTSAGLLTGGAFTTALTQVWKGGKFVGNYKDLQEALAKAITSGQSPQYNEYGPVDDSFRNEHPFGDLQTPTPPVVPPRTDRELSLENQRMLIEAYHRLLDLFGAPAVEGRAITGEHHLVCVHGISTHVSGYSNAWWQALKPYTTLFGAGLLDGTRHEVLWSNLVNSRAMLSPGDAQAAEALRMRIQDVLEDRQRQQVAPVGRSARNAPAERGLWDDRARDFSFDDFIVYMLDSTMRQRIIDRFTQVVRPLLASGAIMDIISHSWGTVVAYEGLRELEGVGALSGRVDNFFTVGSALSLPPVRTSLRAANRDGRRPAMVNRWINVDAQGDLVGGTLADRFEVDVERLELDPIGCQRNLGGLGWFNLQCAHASYFRVENQLVNQGIFAQFING